MLIVSSRFDCYGNELHHVTGSIPTDLLACTHLKKLYLDTGEIPTSMEVIYNLQSLDLSNNKFSGTLSSDFIYAFEYMTTLNVATNSFDGSIPTELCDMYMLYTLYLSQNQFTHSLPDCMWDALSMSDLYLDKYCRNIEFSTGYSRCEI